MKKGLLEKIKTFMNTEREWHYFWLGACITGSLYNLILFIVLLYKLL